MAPLQLKRLGLGDLSTKEFQLEELEDKEECETELWLNDDGSVTLGATNGPQYSNYQGTWDITNDDDLPFRMRLTRSYEVPVGDISYDVIREFWGSLEMVGASVSVSGKIHGSTNAAGNAYTDEQSLVESEIGYFTMIDAVASEASVEGVSISLGLILSLMLFCISHTYLFVYISKAASSHPSGSGMTSYLSSLGGTNSQLHGPGMPSYLDSVGGGGSAADSANVPSGGGATIDGSPSSTVDTQVTHDGSQTTITITSVTTVVI